MLNKGLAVSGENKFYFIKGRFADLKKALLAETAINKILDFGCGIGDATIMLKDYFPGAKITGIDTASEAIAYATKNNSSNGEIEYTTLNEFKPSGDFDLCFVNGVFHHIPLNARAGAIKLIYDSLKKGGYLALFENNPHNPGTRIVMSRIPFDRDAITLTPKETKRMVLNAGFSTIINSRFLFYFPRALSFLRFTEPLMIHLPLGAQYYILAKK